MNDHIIKFSQLNNIKNFLIIIFVFFESCIQNFKTMKRKHSFSNEKRIKRRKLNNNSQIKISEKKQNNSYISRQFHPFINEKKFILEISKKNNKNLDSSNLCKFEILFFGFINELKSKIKPIEIIELILKHYLSMIYMDLDFLINLYIYRHNVNKYDFINRANLKNKAKCYRKKLFIITKQLIDLGILKQAEVNIQDSFHHYIKYNFTKIIKIDDTNVEIETKDQKKKMNTKYIFNYLLSPLKYYCNNSDFCNNNHPVGLRKQINIINFSSLNFLTQFHFHYLKYAIEKLSSLVNIDSRYGYYRYRFNSCIEFYKLCNFLNIASKLSKIYFKMYIEIINKKVRDILFIDDKSITIIGEKNYISTIYFEDINNIFIDKKFINELYLTANKEALKLY